MNVNSVLPYFQLLLAAGNLLIMVYAFSKFLKSPHDSILERFRRIEVKIEELEKSLKQGNDRFRDQDDTNEVLLTSILALIEFEMQYCSEEHKTISKGLEQAKENLHRFLSKR